VRTTFEKVLSGKGHLVILTVQCKCFAVDTTEQMADLPHFDKRKATLKNPALRTRAISAKTLTLIQAIDLVIL
jgi:hypothetical protein